MYGSSTSAVITSRQQISSTKIVLGAQSACMVTASYQHDILSTPFSHKHKQLTNAVILPSLINHFWQQYHNFLQDALA